MMLVQDLMKFIDKSTCNFLAVKNVEDVLAGSGYKQLHENEKWLLQAGMKYYIKRNDTALIAFRVPRENPERFVVTASHSDSPCFKIKEKPELDVNGKYTKLNVEPYGGMILSTWLDRPLSIAGRVLVKTCGTEKFDDEINRIARDENESKASDDKSKMLNSVIETRIIDLEEDVLLIPNQAIHMNREMNNGYAYKKNIDMVPLWGDGSAKDTFVKMLAKKLEVAEEDILDYDLTVYNRMKCTKWGANREFISGPRLDDLECAYISLRSFVDSKKEQAHTIPVYCLYDNEEVGSATRNGAGSTFLKDTMKRILYGLGQNEEAYLQCVADSYMVSADNAHAVHPNHVEMSDNNNRCYMNEGIAIKYQSAQKYATDGVSAAKFRLLALEAGAKVQSYMNRSDQAGGSTLGNISSTQVPMRCVDIGLPQLAMHSAYETAGVNDIEDLYIILRHMYENM